MTRPVFEHGERCYMCHRIVMPTEATPDHVLKGIDWTRDRRGRPRCPDHPDGRGLTTVGQMLFGKVDGVFGKGDG